MLVGSNSVMIILVGLFEWGLSDKCVEIKIFFEKVRSVWFTSRVSIYDENFNLIKTYYE